MQHPSQQSVEEILKAIQKVIESDNRVAAGAERRRRENDGVMLNGAATDQNAAETGEDLVEPVDAFEDDEACDILDLGLSGAAMLKDEPGSAQAAASPASGKIAPERIIAQIEETLTSERAAESMRRSLSNLSRISEAPQSAGVPAGETTVEQLVRDMLRPLLAQWLDAHLPQLVEKLVRDEISRIASKRG